MAENRSDAVSNSKDQCDKRPPSRSTVDPLVELYCREHGLEMTAEDHKEEEEDERDDQVEAASNLSIPQIDGSGGITWAVHTAVGIAAACFLTYCIAYFYGLSTTKLHEMLDEIAGNISAIVRRRHEEEAE
ncbi:hypothetical protein PRIPAC_92696 [Pristionchus pacificus]|uniref:Uncharacterized protein n=1 Tax=Pristionchus pacificus TaxID=54126 RepID=A0A2A6CCX8_PRIPA|nr:hypothetical protein PRIPAC_92696 [Pristionchus pacificus]|eukprot:PDM76085.1 hypothetical protein PRIPAC_39689 [Pristionchus pacificus]